MKRIDTSTKSVDLFGAGKHGYKDGNKSLGIPATQLDASVFNNVQEEISNVIEAAGITLNGTVYTQLLTAIGVLTAIGIRETTIVSSATPTPPADTTDIYTITALAVAATIGAPTSATATLKQGQAMVIRIKDNGTARALTWNAIYRGGTNVLPATTIVGKTHYIGLFYNVTDTKWDVIGVPYVD